MRDRTEVHRTILESGIIAVIRASNSQMAFNLAEAAYRGGITAVEITMTVPGGLEIIRELAEKYRDSDLMIGAGTVMDAPTARLAILSQAEYIICPHLDIDVIKTCHRYNKLCIPGAMSVTEIVQAMTEGADLVKIFPASILGPGFIKAVRGPLPQAMMVPTGGVNIDNIEKWFEAGAVAVAVGSELTKEAILKSDYGILERTAREYVTRAKAARQKFAEK
ncbi:MAG: bifunctional 2-keto-4-hydroxyglutarate aldolase/2-keto-3-deoxy-6-phosphogluconate aldolase [Spirochaetales bacterium]|nr:bifunctional 2-keto-4-hydroxyglutarate aldolase/2-keto-3-deoxy-6-phosphogluconate aldolase [Spirochaetales bacterium]